ncbi:MAG TPA: hypothetical protein VLQ93_08270 [Myxococcaceae bacterium]|nr:hypothetical protein [Myxococcaceae bacterium]
MLLELTAEEARELKQLLDTALGELHDEIGHTDNRNYREMLRGRYQRLEQINRRLETAVESEQVYA